MKSIFLFLVVVLFVFKTIVKKIGLKSSSKRPIYVNNNFFRKIINGTFQNKSKFTNFTKNNMKKISPNIGSLIASFFVIIIIVVVFLNIVITIDAGHTGVVILFGKVKDKELSSGIHIINPFDKIKEMSVRTEEYTMSVTHGEGQRKGSDQISALTNEGLQLELDITVFYRLKESKASDVYKKIGMEYEEKIIRPVIRSSIREVVAKYNAKAIYSEKRSEVANKIKEYLISSVEPRGIIIEQVLIRNVKLPKGLANSIQLKLQAEQDAERLDFVLNKEKKEAERKRIEAQGQSDAQKILNETLTPKYLQYLYINELKDRQGTIYVPTGSDGLPMIKSIQ